MIGCVIPQDRNLICTIYAKGKSSRTLIEVNGGKLITIIHTYEIDSNDRDS